MKKIFNMKKKINRKKNRSLEEGNEHASPKSNILGNSPKRSKRDHKTVETRTHQRVVDPNQKRLTLIISPIK